MKRPCAVISACLIIGLLAGCRRDDQIQTYTAPKESQPPPPPSQNQPAPGMSMMGADASAVPVNSTPIHWTTPAGWKEMPPTSIRLGNFVVPGPGDKKAEVTILSFPGDVGGALANVNRWRREVGLADIAENEIVSEKAVVDSNEGKLYEMAGATERTVVAMIPRAGASWFFKMRGDSDVVAGAKPAFLEFLKSVHFGASDAAAMPSNPHAGMDMGAGMGAGMGMAAAAQSGDQPKWNAPANWAETPPGAMIMKSFSISGDAGQKAVVTISALGGEGGGTLANVNRWRGQLSLPEVAEDGLPKITQSLDVLGGKATLVDLSGTDAAGQPSRMVAVIVPHGGQTWFYKLTGSGAVVAHEKDVFTQFVQTVRYP
ncbi:MAG: hypothetical protein ABSG04_10185 [Verrucomicrobiota bacterium]